MIWSSWFTLSISTQKKISINKLIKALTQLHFPNYGFTLSDSLHRHATISVQTSQFPLWINQSQSKVQQNTQKSI